jgi:hypothetical protein
LRQLQHSLRWGDASLFDDVYRHAVLSRWIGLPGRR